MTMKLLNYRPTYCICDKSSFYSLPYQIENIMKNETECQRAK